MAIGSLSAAALAMNRTQETDGEELIVLGLLLMSTTLWGLLKSIHLALVLFRGRFGKR